MRIVKESLSEGVIQLTLNRPEKRNALDGESVQALLTALQDAENTPQLRCLVLTANGKDFCAGADLGWMQTMAAASAADNQADAALLACVFHTIYKFPCPVLVVVQGKCYGGGLGMVAAADIVIAADTAEFAFPEARMGLCPSVISPYVVPIIGARAARYYFLTADTFNAHTAQKLGLVQTCVAATELVTATRATINKLLALSPHALAENKKLLDKLSASVENFRDMTAVHLATMRISDDAREGLQAFLQKRTPHWSRE